MGWTPGEGLGKDRDGPLEPLTLDAVVNGVEYEPIASSASKKTGKAQVCAVVLQSLGLMQNDEALW
uniref:G-patch domain-containing protein n=1 Tax=Parascaris equorum TaxID=6256 RepID=A0A914R7A3_PAREQ